MGGGGKILLCNRKFVDFIVIFVSTSSMTYTDMYRSSNTSHSLSLVSDDYVHTCQVIKKQHVKE